MVRRLKQSIERKSTEGILRTSASTCEPTSLGFLFLKRLFGKLKTITDSAKGGGKMKSKRIYARYIL